MKFAVVLLLSVNLLVFGDDDCNRLNLKPDGPEKIKKNVQVTFSPDNFRVVEFPMAEFPELYFDKAFNTSRRTVIYWHGWLVNSVDKSVTAMRAAYRDFNVVAMDWSHYSVECDYYGTVRPQLKLVRNHWQFVWRDLQVFIVQKIAETFAGLLQRFLEYGYDINLLHLAGHSLGGQAVGKIARHLTVTTRGKFEIPMIVALDPAGPGFEKNALAGFAALSKGDAKFVEVIHTDAGVLGMNRACGTIDFFPNGGYLQPGEWITWIIVEKLKGNCQVAIQLHQSLIPSISSFATTNALSFSTKLPFVTQKVFQPNVVHRTMIFWATLKTRCVMKIQATLSTWDLKLTERKFALDCSDWVWLHFQTQIPAQLPENTTWRPMATNSNSARAKTVSSHQVLSVNSSDLRKRRATKSPAAKSLESYLNLNKFVKEQRNFLHSSLHDSLFSSTNLSLTLSCASFWFLSVFIFIPRSVALCSPSMFDNAPVYLRCNRRKP
jgi:pimeloyl-ACP methyl ester carboxylesterase